jgi:ribosomal protein S27E
MDSALIVCVLVAVISEAMQIESAAVPSRDEFVCTTAADCHNDQSCFDHDKNPSTPSFCIDVGNLEPVGLETGGLVPQPKEVEPADRMLDPWGVDFNALLNYFGWFRSNLSYF